MSSLSEKFLAHRVARFGLTGGLASLTHISVAFAMLHFSASSVFAANLIGFACAFSLSYLMQSLFVFKKSLSLKNATRFFIVQFSALLISQLISESLSDTNNYLRVMLVVFMIPMVTYVIHRFWTYKETPPSTD
ncbi:polysaccharide synthesis protein GtrA [Enterovibrio norvegicus FF-33]|uniref:GtrA family protein n=1 Tax=Enterovibrio norvegicus TaxID=188144 RepID=UPI0002FC9743|nr:GtrA family protein [Enterovibrio norvegicus]OEE68782.1 polysaccharide synthesis protein GtrA [Enterovibrio norvegicus FF-33]